jgi:mycothiol synthase
MGELEAVADLLNASSIEQTGTRQIEAAQLRTDWQRASFSLETDSLVVIAPDGGLAGYVAVWDSAPHARTFVTAEVHPGYKGRGVGAALCRWADERVHQSFPKAPEGARVVVWQEKLSADEAARDLLLEHGYQAARYELRMLIEMAGPPSALVVLEGVVIRPFIRGKEDRALIQAAREAFSEHWGYVERPFEEEFREWMQLLDNPDNDPELWFVAVDGDEIAGTSFGYAEMAEDPELGWVYGLGVRKPWRRRGLGLALLLHSFGALYQRGKRRMALNVDAENLTGATRLYEKAGMHVERQQTIYERELRPGKEPGTV